MFFLHIRRFEAFAIPFAILLIACGSVWIVRKRRNLIRIPAIVFGSPVALIAALFVGLQFLTLGCESNSAPIYSPDHQQMLRVSDWDAGATGGGSSVELLTHFGFISNFIYNGDWKSVAIADVRWNDNSHVEIHYVPNRYFRCSSTLKVHVECVRY